MPPRSRTSGRSGSHASIEFRSLVLLAALALCVGLLGGSARADAVQIVALRPLGAIIFAIALYMQAGRKVADARPLVIMLGALIIWMLAQLIPLPPGIWRSLPARDLISQLDDAVGIDATWRPISLSPSRELNALFSLIIPAAALFVAIATQVTSRTLLQIIGSLGLIDAVLGLLQIVSGRGSPLYFYKITNDGSAVGLFANENHSAVFSAIALLIVARLGATSKTLAEPMWLRISYAPVFVILLLVIVVSGSRVGLTMGLLSLGVSFVIFLSSVTTRTTTTRGQSKFKKWIAANPRKILAGVATAVTGLVLIFIFFGRASGFESAVSQDPFADLRWKIVPILARMIEDHWLVGAGFGSFDRVYMIYEPSDLLMLTYVNQAHNDWAQLLIEGGIPAVAILLVLFVWLAQNIRRIWRSAASGPQDTLFWLTVIAILCVASIFDYPLRTPIFQMIAVWLLFALSREAADAAGKSP